MKSFDVYIQLTDIWSCPKCPLRYLVHAKWFLIFGLVENIHA